MICMGTSRPANKVSEKTRQGSMSLLLESESDNDDSGQSSSANSENDLVSQPPRLSRNPSSISSSNMVQRKLEHFSRRLSMLGLASSQEEGDNEDSNVQSGVIESDGLEVPKTEVPMTTSLLLNKLPKATNEAFEKNQKEEEDRKRFEQENKVQIKFLPIGSIPQINPVVCKISASQPFALITTFLSRRLKVSQVYCYINNSFAPNPQQIVGDLWSQFKVDDELIVSYCGTVAFG